MVPTEQQVSCKVRAAVTGKVAPSFRVCWGSPDELPGVSSLVINIAHGQELIPWRV